MKYKFFLYFSLTIPIFGNQTIDTVSLSSYSVGGFYSNIDNRRYGAWFHYGKEWLYNFEYALYIKYQVQNNNNRIVNGYMVSRKSEFATSLFGIKKNGLFIYAGSMDNGLFAALGIHVFKDQTILFSINHFEQTRKHTVSFYGGESLKIGTTVSKTYRQNHSEYHAEFSLAVHTDSLSSAIFYGNRTEGKQAGGILFHLLEQKESYVFEPLINRITPPIVKWVPKFYVPPTPKKPEKKKKPERKIYKLSLQELLKEKIPLSLALQISAATSDKKKFFALMKLLPKDAKKKVYKLQFAKKKLDPTVKKEEIKEEDETEEMEEIKIIPLPKKDSDPLQFTIGTNQTHAQYRYTPQVRSNLSMFILQLSQKNYGLFADTRNDKLYGSVFYKNNYIYVSSGNRYKPVQSFFLAKDNRFFSSFLNPKQGAIEQPLVNSHWFGLFPNAYSIGIFHADRWTKDKPGIYFHFPDRIFNVSYIPEKELGDISLQLYKKEFEIGKIKGMYSVFSEFLGNRKYNFGYWNALLTFPDHKIEIESSINKEGDSRFFTETYHSKQSTNYLAKVKYNQHNRLEVFYGFDNTNIFTMAGANTPVFLSRYGAICLGARSYTLDQVVKEWNVIKENSTLAFSTSYEYRLYSTWFMLRLEERMNRDRYAEVTYTQELIKNWRASFVYVVQKKGNIFPISFEGWNDALRSTPAFSFHREIMKFRIASPYLIINISANQKDRSDSDIFYANVQAKYVF
jgi:hypothetical protein